jgi:hypothetical protein
MVAVTLTSDKKQKKNGQYASLQFYRTALCNDYKNGTCPRGDKCTFAHGEDNLCSRPCLTKTKMCPHRNCSKINCGYAHSRKELVSTGSFWKTEMCRFGIQCKIKQTCRFAHDQEELRTKTYNGQEISGEERQKMEDQMVAQQNSIDDHPRRRGSDIKKTRKKTQNSVDIKLGKLMDSIDEDCRDTTVYCSNLSHDDNHSGPHMNIYSDEIRSLDNSDYSDLGEQISALNMMREQCPPVSDLWMSGVHSPLFNSPSTPNVLGTLNQLGLTSNVNSMNAPYHQNSSSSITTSSGNTVNNQPSSNSSVERLWWTITEDDLVCAMPEYYED